MLTMAMTALGTETNLAKFKQAGAKLNGHRHTGSFNDGAGAKAGGLFINLN